MSDDWAFYAEITLVYGAALGLGFQQLWSLRRDRLKREAEEEEAAKIRRENTVY